MSKVLVILGIVTLIIGIGFGVGGLLDPEMKNVFPVSAVIWTIGTIALGLGLKMLEKEEIYPN
jgi:hypothetical protein